MRAKVLPSLSPSRRNLLGAIVIAAATVLAYWPAMGGPFLLDDDLLLTQNKLIDARDGLYRLWFTTEPVDYWPVSNSSLWLEWRVWRYYTTGYKATNLILHIAAALLIWAILKRLSIPGAWLAAFAFAVHPVNVESVAWIAQRKSVLSLLFFLASIYSFVRFDDESSSAPSVATSRSGRWYLVSLTSFLLAMLSKASVVSLPLVLGGIVLARRRMSRADLLRLVPYLAIASVLTLLNIWFRSHGKEIEVRNADFVDRILGAAGVTWFYLYKAFVPIRLAFIYPQWNIDAGNWRWWLPLLAAVGTTAVLWHYRGRWAKPWWLAWLYFCVTLLPAMGFVDAGYMKHSLVADHYQYLSLIGVVVLMALLWSRWRNRAFQSAPNAADLVAAAAIGALMFLTWLQCGYYTDELKLYRHSLAINPRSAFLHGMIGDAIMHKVRLAAPSEQSKLFAEAGHEYEQAMNLDPTNVKYPNNLGVVQNELRQLPAAIASFGRALQVNSEFAEAYRNMAYSMSLSGRWDEAVVLCKESIERDPSDIMAHRLLGIALTNTGRQAEAESQFARFLEQDPDNAEIWWRLAAVQADLGKRPAALESAQRALRLAREQGQPMLTKKIERFIELYRADQPLRVDELR